MKLFKLAKLIRSILGKFNQLGNCNHVQIDRDGGKYEKKFEKAY